MVEGEQIFMTCSKYNIFKYLHKFTVLRGILQNNERMLGKLLRKTNLVSSILLIYLLIEIGKAMDK